MFPPTKLYKRIRHKKLCVGIKYLGHVFEKNHNRTIVYDISRYSIFLYTSKKDVIKSIAAHIITHYNHKLLKDIKYQQNTDLHNKLNVLQYFIGIIVEEKSMTDEEKQLRREQCLSRHDSIRTQANIQLLNERINLIGSLKAHREHCQ